MYKRIVLAVDLAEPSPAPKGLTQAIELAKTGGGELRLVNVQPVIPATFMEYVPVDFDVDQAKRAKASSILEISLRWRSRARSSMARSLSDEARSARSGWF